jgi:hypothetical protein
VPARQDEDLLVALKAVAAELREAGLPFALGGGLAAWARGGPPTEKDIDLLIRADDAEAAMEVLERAGLRTEVPPEGWLVKAYDGDLLIDLIHHPAGIEVTDEFLAGCDEVSVHGTPMLVMPIDDLMSTKLLSLGEHHLDFAPALEIARSLREQIDWEELWARTHGSPVARAFFALVRELGVTDFEPDQERAS